MSSVVDGKFPASKYISSRLFLKIFLTILDELIIKRRLTADGEGVGDDRKINLLLKTFTKWCSSTSDPSSDVQSVCKAMESCEFSVLKSELSELMIDEEMKNYKKVSDNIAERIEMVSYIAILLFIFIGLFILHLLTFFRFTSFFR